IRSNDSVQRAFEQALQATGHVDWLVNSTSLSIFGDPLALEDDDWSAVLDTKLLGYVRTTRVVIRHLLETERAGAIVNISGRGGRQPKAVHLPGGAANAAVNLLTKGFADAYGARGIRVNAVAPGPIDSSRLAELDAVLAANPRVDTSGREPTGRPENIASAVAYLLSDEAAFINGTVLAVDGGSLKAV
ncbi:MAG: SDR family NAD(P)-dependent oxidoreductase, partial [Janthinobacterium lividum]